MENPVVLRPNEFTIPVNLEVDSPQNHVETATGFPFDEDTNDRLRGRSDIRTHLDDLARRHPDLADQLRGFPGGDDPVGFNSRKESTVSSPKENKNTPDSNSSGPTSGGEQNTNEEHKRDKIGNLQNHGLRNTVPLVEPKASSGLKMNENQDQRGSRAQSAPPPHSNEDGQRFVSKIEIQPNHNNSQDATKQSESYNPAGANNENQAPQGQNQQAPPIHSNQNQQQFQETAKPPPVKQPNVRHIPIFVEGRDAPIVNRDHEPSSFHHDQHGGYDAHAFREPIFEHREPVYEQTFSHPQASVPLDRPFGNIHPHQEPDGFDIPVQHVNSSSYRSPNQFGGSSFSKPKHQQQQPTEKVHRVFQQFQEPPHGHHKTQSQTQQSAPHHTQQQQKHAQGPPHQQEPQGQDASDGGHAPSPPPKKISKPKTPLELIQEVQGEVDKYKQQIEGFQGGSRSDKEYIYLDEMLTRELLKLDNIDSGGVEEIRNLRRNTIKNIQNAIAFLESKVPNTPVSSNQNNEESTNKDLNSNETKVDEKKDQEQQQEQPMEVEEQPNATEQQAQEKVETQSAENQSPVVMDEKQSEAVQAQQPPAPLVEQK